MIILSDCAYHLRVDSTTHLYHGQPYARVDLNSLPELTLSPSQELWIWPHYCQRGCHVQYTMYLHMYFVFLCVHNTDFLALLSVVLQNMSHMVSRIYALVFMPKFQIYDNFIKYLKILSREMEIISPTFGDFFHYPHRRVPAGHYGCKTEYRLPSPLSTKCNVLRESLSKDSQIIPYATLKRRGCG